MLRCIGFAFFIYFSLCIVNVHSASTDNSIDDSEDGILKLKQDDSVSQSKSKPKKLVKKSTKKRKVVRRSTKKRKVVRRSTKKRKVVRRSTKKRKVVRRSTKKRKVVRRAKKATKVNNATKAPVSKMSSKVATSDKKATASDKKATASDKKATASSKKATASDKKATASSKKATASSKKATASSKKATASGKKVVNNRGKAVTPARKPSTNFRTLQSTKIKNNKKAAKKTAKKRPVKPRLSLSKSAASIFPDINLDKIQKESPMLQIETLQNKSYPDKKNKKQGFSAPLDFNISDAMMVNKTKTPKSKGLYYIAIADKYKDYKAFFVNLCSDLYLDEASSHRCIISTIKGNEYSDHFNISSNRSDKKRYAFVITDIEDLYYKQNKINYPNSMLKDINGLNIKLFSLLHAKYLYIYSDKKYNAFNFDNFIKAIKKKNNISIAYTNKKSLSLILKVLKEYSVPSKNINKVNISSDALNGPNGEVYDILVDFGYNNSIMYNTEKYNPINIQEDTIKKLQTKLPYISYNNNANVFSNDHLSQVYYNNKHFVKHKSASEKQLELLRKSSITNSRNYDYDINHKILNSKSVDPNSHNQGSIIINQIHQDICANDSASCDQLYKKGASKLVDAVKHRYLSKHVVINNIGIRDAIVASVYNDNLILYSLYNSMLRLYAIDSGVNPVSNVSKIQDMSSISDLFKGNIDINSSKIKYHYALKQYSSMTADQGNTNSLIMNNVNKQLQDFINNLNDYNFDATYGPTATLTQEQSMFLRDAYFYNSLLRQKLTVIDSLKKQVSEMSSNIIEKFYEVNKPINKVVPLEDIIQDVAPLAGQDDLIPNEGLGILPNNDEIEQIDNNTITEDMQLSAGEELGNSEDLGTGPDLGSDLNLGGDADVGANEDLGLDSSTEELG